MKLSKSFNPQLVQFKIKNTLLNKDTKVYKNKTQHNLFKFQLLRNEKKKFLFQLPCIENKLN